ncbi:hypothetical protein MTR67_052598, partial [Solanum verrucosum]
VRGDIYTDHRCLPYIISQNDLNLRHWRWIDLLKGNVLSILFHLGKGNVVADVLSWKAVTIGSLDFLYAIERPLAPNIHSLAK